MNTVRKEIALILTISTISFFIFSHYDALEKITTFSKMYESYEIDELISTSIVLVFLLLIFSYRRLRETTRKKEELQIALNEIKTLKGIIPICSYCKNIRDEEGAWNKLEAYIDSHTDAQFSHGACPECYKKLTEEFDERQIAEP